MELKRSGSQPSSKGPDDWFTGNVRIDPLFPTTDPSRVSAALVTFEPGARTAWHKHPLGQPLIVTEGVSWTQVEGGPAPVCAYIDELLPDVMEGRIQPGRVFDRTVDLDGVPDGYRAMNDREALKVMVRP